MIEIFILGDHKWFPIIRRIFLAQLQKSKLPFLENFPRPVTTFHDHDRSFGKLTKTSHNHSHNYDNNHDRLSPLESWSWCTKNSKFCFGALGLSWSWHGHRPVTFLGDCNGSICFYYTSNDYILLCGYK